MKRMILLAALAVLMMSAGASAQEEETFLPDTRYELLPLVTLLPGEEAELAMDVSYYSGEPITKGDTSVRLTGACALHSAAVVISNLTGETVTGQEVAAANNRDIRQARSWTNFVSWGKVGSRWGVDFASFNMAQYSSRLKAQGVIAEERRQHKLETLREVLLERGEGTGVILHFNATGQQNGDGHKHVVVLVGSVLKDGAVTDLLVSDSNVKAPKGACVRLSESSLPLSMMGQRALDQAVSRGDNLAMLMMDYLVTYRYIISLEAP